MRRREFITLLGGAAAASLPLAARAQQVAMPVVGYFTSRRREDEQYEVAPPLPEGGRLREGQNVVIEYRSAENRYKVPALAADLVRRRVAVIAALGVPRRSWQSRDCDHSDRFVRR
jgi:putative ABC transport system substrate-binding protein